MKFTSFDEMFADAENLAASPRTRMLGHWQLGQLLSHLAWTVNRSIDGIPFTGPWYLRLVGFFIKGRVIRHGLPTGIKLPKRSRSLLFRCGYFTPGRAGCTSQGRGAHEDRKNDLQASRSRHIDSRTMDTVSPAPLRIASQLCCSELLNVAKIWVPFSRHNDPAILSERKERVPDDLPKVPVWVGKVAAVSSPENVLCRLRDRPACRRCQG